MTKKKIVKLRQIFQAGEEGWVEYPTSMCEEHGVTTSRPRGWPATWTIRKRGEFVYVQGEDAHSLIELRLEDRDLAPRYTQWEVAGFSQWIKGDQWPKAKKWKGDK